MVWISIISPSYTQTHIHVHTNTYPKHQDCLELGIFLWFHNMKYFVKTLNKEKYSQRLILVWLLFPMGFCRVECQINLPLMSLQFYWMCLWVNHISQRNQSDLCQWHGCFQKVWLLTLGHLSSLSAAIYLSSRISTDPLFIQVLWIYSAHP